MDDFYLLNCQNTSVLRFNLNIFDFSKMVNSDFVTDISAPLFSRTAKTFCKSLCTTTSTFCLRFCRI